eukprot:6475359-Alexandrium_andersonii.AAC.1
MPSAASLLRTTVWDGDGGTCPPFSQLMHASSETGWPVGETYPSDISSWLAPVQPLWIMQHHQSRSRKVLEHAHALQPSIVLAACTWLVVRVR